MALFEGYERRVDSILPVLKEYGINSIEETDAICKEKGVDVAAIVRKVQGICFDNACWAYTAGAAIAIKKGTGPPSEKRKQELIKQIRAKGKLSRPMEGEQRRISQAQPYTEDSMEPSVKNLRNAIIWSEILSPPVALRKDREP